MSVTNSKPCPTGIYKTKVLVPKEGCQSVLERDMMLRENYKYIILYDLDLQGETITVPEGSILSFQGGSLKNGTIIGQNTFIENSGDFDEIWREDLIREGTWRTGIDPALDETSDHAVENRVVVQALRDLMTSLGDAASLLENYYTKLEIDALQIEQDEVINTKLNADDLHDAKLTIQRNGNDVAEFTANSDTPVTANIDVPTKVSQVENDADYANKEFVRQKIADLVNGAPDALDTLKEIADALNNDANLAATLTNEISTKVDKITGKGLSTNDYTTIEKNKLAGIEDGAEVNVQSDWSQSNTSSDDYIKNKPTKLSQFTNDLGYITDHQDLSGKVDKETGKGLSTNDYTNNDKNKLDGIEAGAEVNVQSDWNVTDTGSNAYIKNKPTNVSTFINDAGYLTQHQSLSAYALKTELPSVPTKVSAFTNDAGYLTQHQSLSDYAKKSELPTVNNATLTIQKNGSNVGTFTANASQGSTVNITVPTKVSELSNDAGYLTSSPDMSPYALKTELPIVNNATLTIQKNGSNVGTFTANASQGATINIVVPTKTSELDNDSGYLTTSPDVSIYALKSEIPTVPTNVSAFNNDAGYLTEHQSLTSINDAITSLQSRVTELEKLWYLASDGKVRTVGDKAAAAGGFYDTTV